MKFEGGIPFTMCAYKMEIGKNFSLQALHEFVFGTSRVKLYSGWDGLEYLYLAVYLFWKAVGNERFRVDSRKNFKTRLNFLANSVESCLGALQKKILFSF